MGERVSMRPVRHRPNGWVGQGKKRQEKERGKRGEDVLISGEACGEGSLRGAPVKILLI